MHYSFLKRPVCRVAPLGLFLAAIVGCGAMKNHSGTDQILLSDAVDRSIAKIDFRFLAGKKVYFDTTYLKLAPEKTPGFVKTDYIISSMRQQMFAANVRLVDAVDEDKAELIVEARVGGLGSDGSVVTYGIPASNSLKSAASLLPNTPAIPTIPEISFAKKDESSASAKFSLFAYERVSRRPVWQSGISVSKSTSKDVWILGAGPFQSGTIHRGTKFAGSRIGFSQTDDDEEDERIVRVAYDSPFVFDQEQTPLSKPSFATLVAGASKIEAPEDTTVGPTDSVSKASSSEPPRLPLSIRRNHRSRPTTRLRPTTPSSRNKATGIQPPWQRKPARN
jgi:hypothetical protein